MFFRLLACLAVANSVFSLSLERKEISPNPTNSSYKFLGTYVHSDKKVPFALCSNLYLSANDATWESARDDCMDNFQSTLLVIETLSELETVRKFLQDSGDASTRFWVGGTAAGTQDFVWKLANNAEIPFQSWIQWEGGKPSEFTSLDRAMMHFKFSKLTFSAKPNTRSERSVCEYTYTC